MHCHAFRTKFAARESRTFSARHLIESQRLVGQSPYAPQDIQILIPSTRTASASVF